MTDTKTYPRGWRSGKTLQQLMELRERSTIRFKPCPDSEDSQTRAACREFLFAMHAALPDLVARIGELEVQINGVGMQEFRRLEAECERLRNENKRLTDESHRWHNVYFGRGT